VERELSAARNGLAATWGSTGARFARVTGDLAAIYPPPAPEVLLVQVSRNPDLARWNTELEQRAAVLSLEEARRVPNVTVGAGGRHFSDNDDNALVFELSVPLPVFDRNQGAILDASYRLEKAKAERAAAEIGVRAAVSRIVENLRAAFERATALRERILPEAKAAHDGAVDAYKKGLFRYLEVLDAERTVFELRREYIEALASFHSEAADAERVTGTPLEDLVQGSRS
jgi:cobalt-zinc-cadmium efflux system outer membrane protein